MSDRIKSDFFQQESHIAEALKAWHSPAEITNDLLDNLLIVQQEKEKQLSEAEATFQQAARNRVLLHGISELAKQNRELGEVLRLRFVEQHKLWAVANQMSISNQSVSRLQRKAIAQLTQLINEWETAVRQQQIQQLEANLPPATYTKLFGIETISQQLFSLLMEQDGPAVMAVVWLGGIGKTALTDQVVRQIIHQFRYHRVLWIRIEHQTLSGDEADPEITVENLLNELALALWPAQAESLTPEARLRQLREAFQQRPYLIIIDNLESQTNANHVVDQLQELARPTKFLLTSRSRLTPLSSLYNIQLSELSLTDATAFARYYGQERGIQAMDHASDEDIAAIYEVAGGNPLALKLMVSLLDVLSLSEIVSELRKSRTRSIDGMYRHIYQKAWRALSDNGRLLLQAMPLVSETGGTPAYLATVSGLAKGDIRSAINELYDRSLIEVRGTLHEKRYGIHRLTYSFLCNDIIKLPN